jgi:hypothetical protein
MIKSLIYTISLAFLLLFACSHEELPLPTPNTQDNTFGANDTNYVELSPVWNGDNLGYSFDDPHDMTIGIDGIIYVADTGNDRIVAMSKAGTILSARGLDRITDIPHPSGVSIDSKLNLLISNQTDTVYCWNQYFNFVDIDSAATAALFIDPQTNEMIQLTFDEYIDRLIKGEPEMELVRLLFEANQAWIDDAKSLYPIYVAEQSGSSINCVAAGQYGSEIFYITESNFDKISEIQLVPEMAVKTSDGAVLFRYKGFFMRDIAQYGSGAGTVDDPWAIQVDDEGNLYFTQLGGNFRVQKLNYPNFKPAYVLGVHDIMDLELFDAPMDIELDDQNAIFVIDRDTGYVSKFHNGGRNAGQEAYLGQSGLVDAEFISAKGIAATDGIVYILESGENRIRRFQYSISDDDVPDDDKQP